MFTTLGGGAAHNIENGARYQIFFSHRRHTSLRLTCSMLQSNNSFHRHGAGFTSTFCV